MKNKIFNVLNIFKRHKLIYFALIYAFIMLAIYIKSYISFNEKELVAVICPIVMFIIFPFFISVILPFFFLKSFLIVDIRKKMFDFLNNLKKEHKFIFYTLIIAFVNLIVAIALFVLSHILLLDYSQDSLTSYLEALALLIANFTFLFVPILFLAVFVDKIAKKHPILSKVMTFIIVSYTLFFEVCFLIIYICLVIFAIYLFFTNLFNSYYDWHFHFQYRIF